MRSREGAHSPVLRGALFLQPVDLVWVQRTVWALMYLLGEEVRQAIPGLQGSCSLFLFRISHYSLDLHPTLFKFFVGFGLVCLASVCLLTADPVLLPPVQEEHRREGD